MVRTYVRYRLREHYKLGQHGYSKKAAVFAHYQALCVERGAEAAISSTFFGKLVKRAFPEIKTIRKGPRGKVARPFSLSSPPPHTPPHPHRRLAHPPIAPPPKPLSVSPSLSPGGAVLRSLEAH
jgi:hypothetical protein